MKKCTYCGKEYPDEALVCAIDQTELDKPEAHAASEDNSAAEVIQAEEGTGVPDGFRCFGDFDPFEAARLLQRFETDGIRFLIDRVEKSVMTARGIRKQNLIQIYVHQDDDERAGKMLKEDWKV